MLAIQSLIQELRRKVCPARSIALSMAKDIEVICLRFQSAQFAFHRSNPRIQIALWLGCHLSKLTPVRHFTYDKKITVSIYSSGS